MIAETGTPLARRANSIAPAERVLLIGALGMLLVSAGLGDQAGLGGAGGSGPALIAHVHAGSLGWLTLAVLAVALRMAHDGDQAETRPAAGLFGLYVSCVAVVAVAAFVAAAAAGTAAAEAWTGTAALLAVLGFLAWLVALSRATRTPWVMPQLGMAAALVVLVAGTILGAMSAGDTASGNATGAASLGSAHSAVLVVPFVVLAATAVVEWAAARLAGDYQPVTTAGLVQVGALLVAAAVIIVGVLGNDLALVEANIPLELGGIAIFLVRVGPLLLTAGWAKGSRIWLVTGTVALAVDAGLFAHVVFEIGARRYVSIDQVPPWVLFTVDHVTFVAVGTTVLFGAIAAMAADAEDARRQRADRLAAAGLVLGLTGTAAGIGAGSAAIEGAFATVLGIALLVAVVVAGIRISQAGSLL